MQEVITPELAKQIRDYEKSLENWKSDKQVKSRAALYALCIATPLWVVSFYASAATGPINQANWFTAFTFFSFVGALAASIAAIVLGAILITSEKPLKDYVVEKTFSNDGDEG